MGRLHVHLQESLKWKPFLYWPVSWCPGQGWGHSSTGRCWRLCSASLLHLGWTAGAPASDLEGTCQEPLSYKCIKEISLRKRGIYWKNTVEALRPDGGVEPLVGMSQNSQEPGGQTRTRNWKASGTDLALVPLPSCSGLCRLHYSGYCFILLTAGWIGVGDRPPIDLALNFGFATKE